MRYDRGYEICLPVVERKNRCGMPCTCHMRGNGDAIVGGRHQMRIYSFVVVVNIMQVEGPKFYLFRTFHVLHMIWEV